LDAIGITSVSIKQYVDLVLKGSVFFIAARKRLRFYPNLPAIQQMPFGRFQGLVH